MSKKVIIIGGGFGGVYTARHLLHFGFDVILISDRNYFTFTPMLHEIATGGLAVGDIIFEYESFFKNSHFSFIRGKVKNIDCENHSVLVDDLVLQGDFLVIATGSKSRRFDIQGIENTTELKNIDDAKKIKKKIIELALSLIHI